jgi:hypothetical protein
MAVNFASPSSALSAEIHEEDIFQAPTQWWPRPPICNAIDKRDMIPRDVFSTPSEGSSMWFRGLHNHLEAKLSFSGNTMLICRRTSIPSATDKVTIKHSGGTLRLSKLDRLPPPEDIGGTVTFFGFAGPCHVECSPENALASAKLVSFKQSEFAHSDTIAFGASRYDLDLGFSMNSVSMGLQVSKQHSSLFELGLVELSLDNPLLILEY